jgi:phosphohistidine phosphatase SixA
VRVLLVRHAEALPGDPDELRPLSPAGRAAARALGDQLAAQKLDAVVSSPLLRARETAEPIARATGLAPEADERLRPGATLDLVRETVLGRGDTVVVVGHQPDLGDVVFELTGNLVPFAPGTVYEVEL